MKQIILINILLLAMTSVSDAACWKCKSKDGTIIMTDSPKQSYAECEWLARCSNTYSEELERANRAKDAANQIKSGPALKSPPVKTGSSNRGASQPAALTDSQRKQNELDEKAEKANREYYKEKYNNVGRSASGYEDHKRKDAAEARQKAMYYRFSR